MGHDFIGTLYFLTASVLNPGFSETSVRRLGGQGSSDESLLLFFQLSCVQVNEDESQREFNNSPANI